MIHLVFQLLNSSTMSDDSTSFSLLGAKDLAEEIAAAVDDTGRLLKLAFSFMTDEL